MSDTEQLDLVREVTAIVHQLGPAASEPDMHAIRQALAALPGIDASDVRDMRYNEFEVRTEWGEGFPEEHSFLERLRELNVAIAPEPVALLPTAKGYVSVVRYWACQNERLLRVKDTEGPFRREAAEQLRKDVQMLTGHGIVHPYARGTYHWWMGANSGTLVLDSWSAAGQGSETELEEFVEQVESLITRRGES